MTDDEMKAVFADMNMSNVPDDVRKAVFAYTASEENMRYLCGAQFDRDWAAFKARLEREMFTVTEAAAMLNDMPADAFRYFLCDRSSIYEVDALAFD